MGILQCARDVSIEHKEAAICPSAGSSAVIGSLQLEAILLGGEDEEFGGSRWQRMKDESRGRGRESPQVHV